MDPRKKLEQCTLQIVGLFTKVKEDRCVPATALTTVLNLTDEINAAAKQISHVECEDNRRLRKINAKLSQEKWRLKNQLEEANGRLKRMEQEARIRKMEREEDDMLLASCSELESSQNQASDNLELSQSPKTEEQVASCSQLESSQNEASDNFELTQSPKTQD